MAEYLKIPSKFNEIIELLNKHEYKDITWSTTHGFYIRDCAGSSIDVRFNFNINRFLVTIRGRNYENINIDELQKYIDELNETKNLIDKLNKLLEVDDIPVPDLDSGTPTEKTEDGHDF
ncbi:hypothetical protein PBI_PBS1_93 [Bacillus phage PBS1]|uniref:Uncharacterized protein n=1 Tax=Bacillus phage PBS1 TaxID=2884423 RepID=A0A223LDB3_BPPB1|nr:hypothetical protein FK780_gp093 [Bacillus phage PBS1]AST99915.1 hypothetical protein PBI_PBS1_93 [Bacillus phage PBS1]BDE75265.1 hypothetical protein [Bacillus phage PBS1]